MLVALVLAVFVSALGPLAGVLMVLEFGWLLFNLVRVLHAWKSAREADEPLRARPS